MCYLLVPAAQTSHWAGNGSIVNCLDSKHGDLEIYHLVTIIVLQISEAYPEVVAMRSRDLVNGDWSTTTYGQLQEQVTMGYCTVVYY